MTASSRLLPLRPADHRTHRRRGSPPARTMASRRGAVDRWRADIDARVRAETPAGYHLYNRSVPWKEIPTRTRHLQVHLFENRPSLAPDQILEADASIRREKEAEHHRRQAKDAAWLRTEARLREDAARLKALDAARDAPTEVSELVRPHARNRHGEVVDNSGQYLKTGTRAKHLIPTPKGRVPLAQGRAVPVQFSVKHHPREWRDELDDRDENARLRARDPDQDPDADENDRGALAVGEEGPSRAPSAPPSRARTPSCAATPSFAPAGCPPSRAPTPSRRPASAASSFADGFVTARRPRSAAVGTLMGTRVGTPSDARPGERLRAPTPRPASAPRRRETPLGPRSAAIVDRPPSPPGLDTSSRPALRQNVNPTTHTAPTTSADPRPARVSSSSRPSSAPAGPRRVTPGQRVALMFGPGAVEAPRTRKTSRSEIAAAKMGFSYSFAGAGAAAPPKVFAPRTATVSEKVSEKIARRPTSAARYFDAAASARPASSRSRSRASTPDHHDRYRDGLSVAGRAVGTPSFAVGSPVRSATSRGQVGDAGGGVVRPGSTTMEAAANNAPREKGTPRKAVVRPASAFRGEEGRFRGELTRTDVEGEGGAAAFVFGGGDGGERGGGERGGGGAGEGRVDASRVGASSPSSRPASARPAWR